MSPLSQNALEHACRTLEIEARSILEALDRLKKDPSPGLLQAVEVFNRVLENKGKIIVTGVGKSGKIGQKIAATLSSTGSLAIYLHPTEGLHGDLGVVSDTDAVFALSHTGNTEELLQLLPSLKNRKIPIVGMGGNPQSRLAEMSSVWVDGSVSQEACDLTLAPTASTTLALALGDAIAVALMRERGFDEKGFARNHPGGSLGRRMNLLVEDLMHPRPKVGTLPSSASMKEVVEASTRSKLGAVLIVKGDQMEGIITDGDIRRALSNEEKFFQMKASEVMTRNPTLAQPQMRASEACDLMEKRESQISVLPVVDATGKWVGLLRLHDLVQTF